MAKAKLKKIMLKVLKKGEPEWVHFCYVPSDLHDAFFKKLEVDRAEFGSFLSSWALAEFNVWMTMTRFDDIALLREHITSLYRAKYSELYDLEQGESPRVDGWVRLWVSQHMRKEVGE